MNLRIRSTRYWRKRGRVLALISLPGVFSWSEPSARVTADALRVHPVHASSTQVDVSQNHRRLDIAVRMFTDDLEAALAKAGRPVSLQRSDSFDVDSALSRYLGQRLLIGVDGGTPTRARVTQYRQDEDATLVFLEFDLRATPGRITIEQRVMLDQFDDQTNLIHVRFDTMKRSALLRRGNERAEFEFR